MRFIKDEHSGITDKVIQIEHRGEILSWDIVTYRSLKVNENLITDINNYWFRLPMETQDKIFQIYSDISEVFDTTENTRKLNEALVRLVAQLFEYHSFDDVMNYYTNFSRIKLPPDLRDHYVEGNIPELTYLRNEYKDLIVFSICLKIMIPIWGRYIALTGVENTTMKEYRAAALLSGSNIVKCRAYERLKSYTTTYWEGYTDDHSGAAILAGLDGSQVPNYLMGNVLIRRISAYELIQISSQEPSQTIISAIFNYIDNLTKMMDRQFGGRINEKSLENSVGDDDNTSFAENYKIKQEVSEGIIATHEVHLIRHTESILSRLNPEYPVDKFRPFMDVLHKTFPNGFAPTVLSKALCQWVLDPVITAKMLDYVNYEAVLSAHAATYMLLRSWGYNSLALYIFAEKQPSGQMMNNVVRMQVTDQQLEQLEKIYPYSQNVTTKRKPSRRDSNVAVVAIRYVLESLYGYSWAVAPWEDPNQYPTIPMNDRCITLYPDIELQLADLIIFLKTKVHPGLTSIIDLKGVERDN